MVLSDLEILCTIDPFLKDESDLLGRFVPHRSKRMGDASNIFGSNYQIVKSKLALITVADIHEANSKAISLWAKVPPFLPDFDIIPIAYVLLIHLLGAKTKAFPPASFQNWSNSTSLKDGLLIFSQNPRNSMQTLNLEKALFALKSILVSVVLSLSLERLIFYWQC